MDTLPHIKPLRAGELIDLSHLTQVLQDLAKDFRDNYRDHLVESGREASGALVKSVEANKVEDMVKIGDTEFSVSINLEEYWQYVEWDTRPHFPPLDKIEEWIEVKPVVPRPFANGSIPSTKTLAFLIGRAMAGQSPNQERCKNPQGGTTGTHDFERTRDGLLGVYASRIAEAMRMDIQAYLEQAFTGSIYARKGRL